jgi:hypothetical protein
MPSTVAALFSAVGLTSEGVVAWGEPVPLAMPGVYQVALTANAESAAAALPIIPLDEKALARLLARPQLRVDGQTANRSTLAARLAACWLGDEVVVYVGRSGRPLRKRLREYYKTPLGAGRPHAGGWLVKTLAAPLYVHYAATPDFVAAERTMVDAFAANSSPAARARLLDPVRPIPFGNLTWEGHGRKLHGVEGARD